MSVCHSVLGVGVRGVRRTHINDIDVLESREGEVLENFASEATSSAEKGQVGM